ncbi:ABC transporter ATP-binding protein [Microbacterium betulae]|uniref:ABC transporter ATP-binding protein n=1 Tax=Microbacterium betulae TaxID=2981139 RepID=A0AA97FJA6_9MICO|nr:ABC transporter ATP-binding protein [Microbacterium sp. AB]WOF23315.1 ABC transporter ATP-binding protein [Microbacterium sp. AB]
MTGALRTHGLRVDLGGRTVLDDIGVDIAAGATTAIVGPNGSGKSTLLRCLARLQDHRGAVTLDGEDVRRMPARAFARRVALLPQAPIAPDNLTIVDLVTRGRDPYRRWYDQWSSADEAVVHEAIERTGLTDLADRPLETLSGGQRQRAWVALALAQSADVLLLDEPTTYLDIAHQLDVLETVAELQRERGMTVVMVLHDLGLAVRYADHIVAVHGGAIAAAGPAGSVVTPELLRTVFGIDASLLEDPRTGRPVIVPHRAVRSRD